jgi:hypothetical protein
MKTEVEVTFTISVEVDETKFTEEWMTEWQKQFYPFFTVKHHIKHIAQLAARGLLEEKFTEGYGPLADMGIRAKILDQDEEIL